MLLLTVKPVTSRAHRYFVLVIILSVLSLPSFAEPSADAVRFSDTPVIDGDVLGETAWGKRSLHGFWQQRPV